MGSTVLWEEEMALGREGATLSHFLSKFPHSDPQLFPSNQ